MDIFVSPTGSNSNDGLTRLTPVQTIAYGYSLVSSIDDEVVLMDGTHTLTADISLITSCNFVADDGASPVIQGAFRFNAGTSNTVHRFIGIKFKNFAGTNGITGYCTVGTSSAVSFENCTIDGAGYSNSGVNAGGKSILYQDCIFENLGSANNVPDEAEFKDCWFRNPQNTTARITVGTITPIFVGCLFTGYAKIILTNSTSNPISPSFLYCTFDLEDGVSAGNDGSFIEYQSASNSTQIGLEVKNCIFVNCAKMINNISTGSLTVAGVSIRNNCIETSTVLNTTGYNSIDDILTSDVMFVDRNNDNYRLDINSPASIENNGLEETIGAFELEKPTTWFTEVPDNKVEDGYAFKRKSRTNNGLGSLVGGGETDLDFILSSAPNLPGNINPATVMNTNSQGTLSQAKVHPDSGGTLDMPARENVTDDDTIEGLAGLYKRPAQNRVSPNETYGPNSSLTGTQDLPSLSNIPSDETLEGQAGTMDLPDLDEVDPLATLRGQPGTMDVPDLSEVDPLATLRGQPGTMDVPDLSSIDPADTLRGQPGTQDLPELENVSTADTLKGQPGGLIVPVEEDVREDEVYGPNGSLTGQLVGGGTPASDPASSIAGKMIKGESAIIDGVLVNGEYDLDINNSQLTGDKKFDIKTQLENILYSIRPSVDSKYQSVIKRVDLEVGETPGTIQLEDMPFIKLTDDLEETNNRYLAFGGNYPDNIWTMELTGTVPASYTDKDVYRLIEDIKQAVLVQNYTLNGTADSVEIKSSRPLPREEGSESEVRQFELVLQIRYVQEIN